MQRWRTLAAVLTLTPLFVSAAPPTVDNLGDPARLRIEGATVITPDQIRRALANDTEYQLAATPSAPLPDFLKTTFDRLGLAYQRAGFGEPTIHVTYDAPKRDIVIKINESPRLTAGPLLVEGAVNADAKRLVEGTLARIPNRFPIHAAADGSRRIETWGPTPDAPLPLWKKGAPAPLDAITQKLIGADFTSEMARQGFFQPKVETFPQPQGNTAAFIVRIHEERDRAILGPIEINGAKRNSPQDIIRLLGLVEGMPLDTDVLQEIAAKLWNSARFWKHTITASPVPGGGRIKLTIDLDEHPTATLLKDPLNLDETAMLRIRDWLQTVAAGQRDIVFSIQRPELHAKAVVRAGAGFAFRVHPPPKPRGNATVATDFGFVATPQQVAFHNITDQQTLLARPDWSRVRVHGVIFVAPELQPGSTAKQTFILSAEVASKNPEKSAGLILKVVLAPVCFLDLAHPTQRPGTVAASVQDGIITFSAGNFTFRFRQNTGDLVDATSYDKDSDLKITLTVERDALERQIQALEGAIKPKEPPQPLPTPAVVFAAFAHFIADTGSATSQIPMAARTRTISMAREFARQLGLWTADVSSASPDDEFRIPIDYSKFARSVGPLGFLAEALPYTDHLFPRASWPWTVTRESILFAAGRAQHTKSEIARLYRSPDFGPVGCLVVAYAYSHLDATTARIFAKRGLERLTFEHFANDCQVLFPQDSSTATLPNRVLRVLGQLDPRDIDALLTLLPPKIAAPLKLLVQHQKNLPKDAQPLPPPLQKQLWETGLKDALESALKHLSILE
jgi:hypothetical protein